LLQTYSVQKISFKEAFLFWLKLGFISFGGPAGQIAIMHQYLVEKKKWISESVFLHALNYCMLLPGPEAQQLATYSGWLMHGTLGGVVAGLLFILPSVFILTGLCVLYVTLGQTQLVSAVFYGIKPAVVAIVILAVLKISERALKRKVDVALAVASLLALAVFKIPYIVVMLAAIVFGILYAKVIPERLPSGNEELMSSDENEHSYFINRNERAMKIYSKGTTLKLAAVFIILWSLPVLLQYVLSTHSEFWTRFSLFFTQASLFTFGGAYSVLTYVAQYAVEQLHWLTRSQMIDGLALGETTPGPLMMVLPYVGFMGAYQYYHQSIAMGCIGLAVSTYFTFFPSFVFILLGAPFVERTKDNESIKRALSFVTAAVVGVIANLGIFMATAVLFASKISFSELNWPSLGWIIISIIAMKKFNINMITWIGASALFGIVFKTIV